MILDDTGDNVIGLIDTFGYFIPLYPVSYKDKDVNRFVETKNIKSKNYISNINLYTYYLKSEPILALENTKNEHTEVLTEFENDKFEIKVMIYNLSILSNNETSIKDVISAFKIINLEARYLELKRIFTGLLKNYNDKIQSSNNRLVEHNKDIVPGRLTYDALTTFVINIAIQKMMFVILFIFMFYYFVEIRCVFI